MATKSELERLAALGGAAAEAAAEVTLGLMAAQQALAAQILEAEARALGLWPPKAEDGTADRAPAVDDDADFEGGVDNVPL